MTAAVKSRDLFRFIGDEIVVDPSSRDKRMLIKIGVALSRRIRSSVDTGEEGRAAGYQRKQARGAGFEEADETPGTIVTAAAWLPICKLSFYGRRQPWR